MSNAKKILDKYPVISLSLGMLRIILYLISATVDVRDFGTMVSTIYPNYLQSILSTENIPVIDNAGGFAWYAIYRYLPFFDKFLIFLVLIAAFISIFRKNKSNAAFGFVFGLILIAIPIFINYQYINYIKNRTLVMITIPQGDTDLEQDAEEYRQAVSYALQTIASNTNQRVDWDIQPRSQVLLYNNRESSIDEEYYRSLRKGIGYREVMWLHLSRNEEDKEDNNYDLSVMKFYEEFRLRNFFIYPITPPNFFCILDDDVSNDICKPGAIKRSGSIAELINDSEAAIYIYTASIAYQQGYIEEDDTLIKGSVVLLQKAQEVTSATLHGNTDYQPYYLSSLLLEWAENANSYPISSEQFSILYAISQAGLDEFSYNTSNSHLDLLYRMQAAYQVGDIKAIERLNFDLWTILNPPYLDNDKGQALHKELMTVAARTMINFDAIILENYEEQGDEMRRIFARRLVDYNDMARKLLAIRLYETLQNPSLDDTNKFWGLITEIANSFVDNDTTDDPINKKLLLPYLYRLCSYRKVECHANLNIEAPRQLFALFSTNDATKDGQETPYWDFILEPNSRLAWLSAESSGEITATLMLRESTTLEAPTVQVRGNCENPLNLANEPISYDVSNTDFPANRYVIHTSSYVQSSHYQNFIRVNTNNPKAPYFDAKCIMDISALEEDKNYSAHKQFLLIGTPTLHVGLSLLSRTLGSAHLRTSVVVETEIDGQTTPISQLMNTTINELKVDICAVPSDIGGESDIEGEVEKEDELPTDLRRECEAHQVKNIPWSPAMSYVDTSISVDGVNSTTNWLVVFVKFHDGEQEIRLDKNFFMIRIDGTDR